MASKIVETSYKVKVKDIPVYHNGEEYQPGDTLEIDAEHFNENLFEKEGKEK